MRHNKKRGMKLGTDASHTKAMKKSLVTALLANDRIKTLESRAKAIRPDVDRVITWAKRGDLAARRLAIAKLGDPHHEARSSQGRQCRGRDHRDGQRACCPGDLHRHQGRGSRVGLAYGIRGNQRRPRSDGAFAYEDWSLASMASRARG